VRELRNVIDRAVALARDGERIRAESIQLQHGGRASTLRHPSAARPESRGISSEERDMILNALRTHRGNQSEAARSLGGMKRTTLLYKIKKLDIRPEEYGHSAEG
jgi:transcriptional regulator with PAS, ATPase and Fis domain